MIEKESSKHPLNNKWVLWYHDGGNDWTINAYEKKGEFDSVEDFWKLYNNLSTVANNFFFLMKEGHAPIWETPENKDGGIWTYKIPKERCG